MCCRKGTDTLGAAFLGLSMCLGKKKMVSVLPLDGPVFCRVVLKWCQERCSEFCSAVWQRLKSHLWLPKLRGTQG